jgi:ribosomal subunit interface protein
MKIIITTKNLDLTPDLQSFIEKKIGSIKKFINILKQDTPNGLKTLAEVFVEVEKETEHHKKGKVFSVKTQVILPGKSLVAWSRADDMFKAIIGAKDELKMEIEKYKFKKIDKNRRQERKSKREIEK